MNISQEVFDETVLENEQVFELNPHEAVQETLDQFLKQQSSSSTIGTSISTTVSAQTTTTQPSSVLLYHLLWSHPHSTQGQIERKERQEFIDILEALKAHCTNPCDTSKSCYDQQQRLNLVEKLHSTLTLLRQQSPDKWRQWLGYLHLIRVHQGWQTLFSCWLLLDQPPQSKEYLDGSTIEQEENDDAQQQQKQQRATATSIILQTMLQVIQQPAMPSTPLHSSSTDILTTTTVAAAIRSVQHSIVLGWWSATTNTQQTQLFCQHWFRSYHEEFYKCSNDSKEPISKILILLLQLGLTTCLTKRQQILRAWMQPTTIPNCIDDHNLERDGSNDAANDDFTEDKKDTKSIGLPQVLVSTLVHATKSIQSANPANTSSATTALSSIWDQVTLICQWIIVLCQYHPHPPDEDNDSNMPIGNCAHDHVLLFTKPRQPQQSQVDANDGHPHVFAVLLDLANLAINQLETTNLPSATYNADVRSKSFSALAYCFMTLRVLAIQDDLVQTMVSLGVLPVLRQAMTMAMQAASALDVSQPPTDMPPNDNNEDEDGDENITDQTDENINGGWSPSRVQSVLVSSLGLLRNLCANDDMKATLFSGSAATSSSSWVPLLGNVLTCYPRHAKIQEHGCGLLAAMALRQPHHALVLVEQYGCHHWLVAAMQHHPTSTTVQRQACLAIRNLASRATQLSSSTNTTTSLLTTTMLVDTGLEDAIIHHAVPRCPEEAYAALRDLGCASADRYRPRAVQMFGDFRAD